jgi:hypothetical protein
VYSQPLTVHETRAYTYGHTIAEQYTIDKMLASCAPVIPDANTIAAVPAPIRKAQRRKRTKRRHRDVASDNGDNEDNRSRTSNQDSTDAALLMNLSTSSGTPQTLFHT